MVEVLPQKIWLRAKSKRVYILPQAKVIFRQNLAWTTKRSIDKFSLSIVEKYSSNINF